MNGSEVSSAVADTVNHLLCSCSKSNGCHLSMWLAILGLKVNDLERAGNGKLMNFYSFKPMSLRLKRLL